MTDGRGSYVPFLKVMVPAAAGMIAATCFSVPFGVTLACFAAIVVCAVLMRRSAVSNAYVWAAIALFFFGAADINRPRSELPAGERIVAVVQIEESPAVRGRWQTATANVGYWRKADGDDKDWMCVDERIRLSVDTSYHDIEVGAQLAIRGWINPINRTGSGYGRLMQTRGIHRQMYLVAGNLITRSPKVSPTPKTVSAGLQAAAVERLARLDIPPQRLGVVVAMVAGDKRMLESDLRQSYSSSGSAHLLAVSGLHVGIVFVLVNLMLYLLPLLYRGHIAKNIVAIVAMWGYAVLAGLSPSVVRAAFMFSFAQMALATNSYRNGLNIMLGSAVLMLAVNPNYAADPSFVMSYAAVLSIAAFFKPIYSLVETRFRLLNALLAVLIVGLVATLGTAPMVLYWFGQISLVGVLINPVVILTAHVIVMFGVLWLIVSFGFLRPLFSAVLSFAVGVQDAVVGWTASLEWAIVRCDMPLWGSLLTYAVYVSLAVWLYGRRRKREAEPFDV